MNEIYKTLIYLLYCAVNGVTSDAERINSDELQTLYHAAKSHNVLGAVCVALERAGIHEEHFYDAYKKVIRNNIYLDMERTAIISDFEKQGIWYMPLKGSILKELYPENGMREMADNDMLYDAEKQQEVMQIMLDHGYTAESVGKTHHDVYMKPPVLNFELHTALFCEKHAEPLYKYYDDTKQLLHKDENNNYGYHFSDEDFYIFMSAHEWKHYNSNGTGIRSLLDCYVYCNVKGDMLDWNYITEQCKQLEIADFEQERRQLAVKLFSSDTFPELSDSETEMLMYYLTSGTYGTYKNSVEKELKKQSKTRYILHKLFPNIKYMRESVGFVNKFPVLYPVGIVYRWGRKISTRRQYLTTIMKVMRTNK